MTINTINGLQLDYNKQVPTYISSQILKTLIPGILC